MLFYDVCGHFYDLPLSVLFIVLLFDINHYV